MSSRGSQGEVGLALAMLRMLRGWERADLVRALGVSRSWISEIETGKKEPATRTVQRILGALGLPMSAVEEALALVRSVRGMAAAGTAGVAGGGSGGSGGSGGRQARRGGDARALPDAGLAWDETGLSGVLFELVGAGMGAGRGDRRAGDAGEGAGAEAGYGTGEGDEAGRLEPDAARRRAAELWTRLRPYPREVRRVLVSEAVEFQGWALCERLCEESVRAGAESPASAVELAELAVAVALVAPVDLAWEARPARPALPVEMGRPGELPAPPTPPTPPMPPMPPTPVARDPAAGLADADRWRERLAAYAWGFVGAARRLAGDTAGAAAALALARGLGPPDRPQAASRPGAPGER